MIAAVLAACSSRPTAPTEVANAAPISADASADAVNTTEMAVEMDTTLETTAPPNEEDAFCIYSDINYQGLQFCFKKSDVGDADSATGIPAITPNDVISSIQVAPGFQVTLFNDENFSGGGWIFGGDFSDFRIIDFNDMASSFTVQRR